MVLPIRFLLNNVKVKSENVKMFPLKFYIFPFTFLINYIYASSGSQVQIRFLSP